MPHHNISSATDDAAAIGVLSDSSAGSSDLTSAIPGYVDKGSGIETTFESYMDLALGIAFLITALVAARRMYSSRSGSSSSSTTSSHSSGGSSSGAAETTVVTAFYSLILLTSVLRALWFLIPSSVWQPTYTPVAVFAWDHSTNSGSWVRAALSELIVTAGSLTLFSIFILILVYWADILKKYFHPGSRRSVPMATFLGLVASLVTLEVINLILFLIKIYTTEGMILYNAVLLAVVSIVCVCEITIFSHRFRTVLKTLGAINQVSTDSQVRRIVWITVTGNLFFITRALLEATFAILLFVYWHRYGTVDKVFSHIWWDTYTLIKYWSEVTILALMLYILQSRFARSAAASHASGASTSASTTGRSGSGGAYTKIPDAEPANLSV